MRSGRHKGPTGLLPIQCQGLDFWIAWMQLAGVFIIVEGKLVPGCAPGSCASGPGLKR